MSKGISVVTQDGPHCITTTVEVELEAVGLGGGSYHAVLRAANHYTN